MPAAPKPIATLHVRTIAEWRRWLATHHATEREIWLVFHKQHTGIPSIDYKEALDEALCHGWIDSLVRRLDDEQYARKFTPRKAQSRWSEVNTKRYAELMAAGRVAAAGLARPPAGPAHAVPRAAAPLEIPKYLLEALAKNARAKACFDALAPSHKRDYVRWIDSAKRDDTKRRRLTEAIAALAAGKKLGLK